MRTRKYVLHPGIITSRNDGQPHHIDAGRLADLYRVRMSDCVVHREPRAFDRSHREPVYPDYYVHLYPRPDGVYELPEQAA